GDAALGLGDGEAVLDERARRDVELAYDIGVGAAGAQRDQAADIIGGEAVGPVPDPALALGLAERVDVDQRAPFGLARRIAVDRRDPPEAARILGIAPEIGDVIADHRLRHRDLGIVVEDRAGTRSIVLESRAPG